MKKRILYLILSLTVTSNFAFGQSNLAENKKLLIGKWEYNVAYDTIAVADIRNKETEYVFFTDMKISKSKISISDLTEKLNGKWELINNNQFFVYLDNKKNIKILPYENQ